MKKFLKWLTGIVVVLGLVYLGGVGYYSDRFQANTSYGSVDISNMTLADAQTAIESNIKDTACQIQENGQDLGQVKLSDFGAELNSEEILKATYNAQDPRMWPVAFFKGEHFKDDLSKTVKLDQSAVEASLNELGVTNSDRVPAKDAQLTYTEGTGYSVTPEEQGSQINFQELGRVIAEAVTNGKTSVNIAEAYDQPTVTSQDESIQEALDMINDAADTKITLKIQGDEVVIPREKILSWMYFDGNNQMVFDQESIKEDLRSLNEEYSTFVNEWKFNSTLRGEVSVQPGTLGWSVDRDAESAQIVQDLTAGEDVVREVNVEGTGYGVDGGVGDSYIEIDLANQHLFLYKNGTLVLDTPIVSGMAGSSETVAGAYAIWNKELNATLVGTNVQTGNDYRQPVSYWLPFDDTGQGIHDANWQPYWGTDAYLAAGSQGCINVPPDVMPTLFEEAELGMPVMVFK